MTGSVVAYGERPVTQFVMTRCERKELAYILDRIEGFDAGKVAEDDLRMYIEAPLGKEFGYIDFMLVGRSNVILFEVKPRPFATTLRDRKTFIPQIQRYCDCIANPEITDTKRAARRELVMRVRQEIASVPLVGRRLVCVTDDNSFPDELGEQMKTKSASLTGCTRGVTVGFLPYNAIRSVASSLGFRIQGEGTHVWIEGRG